MKKGSGFKMVLRGYLLLACILAGAFITASCDNGNSGDGDTGIETTKVTITFNTDGGSAVASIEIDKGGKLPADYLTGNKIPVKTGYTFNGWKNGATAVTAATTFAQNATLTAQWTASQGSGQGQGSGQQAQQITVSFSLGDGVAGDPPASVTIDNGTALGAKYPADPKRTGYEFSGWFNDNKRYDKNDKITAAAATFVLTAQWDKEYVVENAQSPAIHPGNHFSEIAGGANRTTKVNVDFSADGLFSNVEPGAGVLSSQWYRASSATGEGEEINYKQTAAGTSTPHELALPFTWREPAAGEYWYWVKVTNTNVNATVQKTSSSITQNRLKVTVTE